MSTAGSEYRLDGIYKQRQPGFYMQRVKLPAGVISANQARTVAAVSSHFGHGAVHLTSRGSMEIHWLKEEVLPQVKCELAKSGLSSRGACGGAVRGITCSSQSSLGFPAIESLARRLHRHFTGNPRFERLPKKFKIGIEADVVGGRHLIQDVGLVLASLDDGRASYDIWIAGGLGREPRAGFLLAERVPEERIIPIIEAIIAVYATNAPPPKRLKFLASEFGEVKLRHLIEAEATFCESVPEFTGLPDCLVTPSQGHQRLEIPVFAGKLASDQLLHIADASDRFADGTLMVTADQDIALQLSPGVDAAEVLETVRNKTALAFADAIKTLRVCPGSHECQMGLSATREIAALVTDIVTEHAKGLQWAVSGCSNSCTQPQLAEVGIITTRLKTDAEGLKSPRFDVYRRLQPGLGQREHEGLTLEELTTLLGKIT
ncbi:MAG: nitrite/sulfite reductase [Desulfuromonadaceae bacterium]|nr:nitrite/sulfite reductase [Desulfuromonadaceae bacterium]